MNMFDAQPRAQPRPTLISDYERKYQEELEDFRRTKAKMDREQEEWEAAQRKIREDKEAAERRIREELVIRKDALSYSDELAQEICERISVGELLINICDDARLPSMRRCNQWLRENTDFNLLYQSALNDRLSVFEEEIIKIADDASRDFKTVKEKRVPDSEQVARAKLRIDVRFRHLKAGRPAKWGDISTLNVKEVDSFDTSKLDVETLQREIAEIERKDRAVRKDRAA